jgi:toxin ParE1/3/4
VRVVFSAAAEANLEEIAAYIAKDNARCALTFARELRDVALRLGEMPHASPLIPRYEHHAIRRRPFGNYLIFYRVEDKRVAILHILHGARDYEALLFPPE